MKLLFALFFVVGTFFFAGQAEAATYYVDLNAGSDAAAGTATTTAFKSMDQFAENTRAAGDVAWVRRGTASTTVYSDLTFTTSGTLNAPITLSADYDNLWGDFYNSAQTYNVTFGSTTMTSSASTTDINVGDWVYVVGDHTEDAANPTIYGKDFAYEVATLTPTYIQFYLPYKGPSTGSKTLRVMPDAPTWNNIAGDFNLSFVVDSYWYLKGLNLNSTDSGGVIALTQEKGFIFNDMSLSTDGVTAIWMNVADISTLLSKSRVSNMSVNGFPSGIRAEDLYVNCVTPNLAPFSLSTARVVNYLRDIELANCTYDVVGSGFANGGIFEARNFKRTGVLSGISSSPVTDLYFEDDRGVPGLNMSSSNKISSDTITTSTQSTTLNLRTGGANKNLLVLPPSGTGNTGISTKNFPFSFIQLFKYPVYAASNTPYTYTMYFKNASTTGTSDWTADPTASEMWIEAEYFGDTVDADRKLTKSTGTLDFNGTTDWVSLSVSATTTQDGILYLRGWYGKPRETGKANSFYMDLKPVISSP